MPISSWAAAVSGVANDMNTGISGIQLLMKTIPYNFYSLLTFVFIIALITMQFDYGKMKLSEMNALLQKSANGKDENSTQKNGKVIDLVLPVFVLVVSFVFAMLYAGGFYGKTAWVGDENSGNIIASLGATDAFIALPMASLFTLIFSCIYFSARKTINFKEMANSLPKGFTVIIPSILILTLSATLKTVTTDMGTAEFVHSIMADASGSLYKLLTAVIFVVSVGLAFATGTSWGTFAILIPVVVAVFPNDSSLLIIGIAACLAGAVCGDHCSPISDTTVMASAGAEIDHIEHVETQLPYALTVAAISFVTYIIAGFSQNWVLSLAACKNIEQSVYAVIR